MCWSSNSLRVVSSSSPSSSSAPIFSSCVCIFWSLWLLCPLADSLSTGPSMEGWWVSSYSFFSSWASWNLVVVLLDFMTFWDFRGFLFFLDSPLIYDKLSRIFRTSFSATFSLYTSHTSILGVPLRVGAYLGFWGLSLVFYSLTPDIYTWLLWPRKRT